MINASSLLRRRRTRQTLTCSTFFVVFFVLFFDDCLALIFVNPASFNDYDPHVGHFEIVLGLAQYTLLRWLQACHASPIYPRSSSGWNSRVTALARLRRRNMNTSFINSGRLSMGSHLLTINNTTVRVMKITSGWIGLIMIVRKDPVSLFAPWNFSFLTLE